MGFWASVIAALRTCLPSIGELALAQLHAQRALAPSVILTHLLNEMEQVGEELILLLDDYHVISDPAIQQDMLFLLEHLPACMHLVLATRIDPEFPSPAGAFVGTSSRSATMTCTLAQQKRPASAPTHELAARRRRRGHPAEAYRSSQEDEPLSTESESFTCLSKR